VIAEEYHCGFGFVFHLDLSYSNVPDVIEHEVQSVEWQDSDFDPFCIRSM